jgi:mannose-6-phosphate isomerase-like protein (cupin superfamily)
VLSFDPVIRFVAVAATLAALTVTTGASANVAGSDAIEPGTRVNGMFVVQGLARDADVALFGYYCDPVVLTAGRRTRVCSTSLPPVRRIFVGHGTWAVSRRLLDAVWNAYAGRTEMWIDGQPVRLTGFGHSDRWLLKYPPADGRNALLREWSIVLVGAKGRHSIRYRGRLPQLGVTDVTWKFTVATR